MLLLTEESLRKAEASSPNTFIVSLSWDPSPDSTVVAYNLYYGTNSGIYPNVINLNTVTNITVSGLQIGVTYYFAVTAVDTNTYESTFSNEVSYKKVAASLQLPLQMTPNGNFTLSGAGQANHSYDIQATGDFISWTTIGSTTADTIGSFSFTDTNATSFTQRFYRTSDSQP